MGDFQQKIETALVENVEKIEAQRYNSEDPTIIITGDESIEDILIKILTSERTAAPLKVNEDWVNPSEDIARKSFIQAVRALNNWQFKKSQDLLDEAAKLARGPLLQQQINLYKQLRELIRVILTSNPETILRWKGKYFGEVLESLTKYDKMSDRESNYYQKSINQLLEIAKQLQAGNREILSQRLVARSASSLLNQEYLAAYLWQYKIYLLNQEQFDSLAAKEEHLSEALTALKNYLQSETGLGGTVEEEPTIASPFDLHSVFIDYLTKIFALDFLKATKENFTIPRFYE
ncbi:MAG: hypothetical protein GF308_08970 [Candidatus Heimdallarchaeota archaeon]|nr:hypothetical protein [Candidatus Heimdallarchaeota archaeon]